MKCRTVLELVGAAAAAGYVFRKELCSFFRPAVPDPLVRVHITVYEKDSGDILLAGVAVVREDYDSRGRYRFHRPNGTAFDLDLSAGAWRIVRHMEPVGVGP